MRKLLLLACVPLLMMGCFNRNTPSAEELQHKLDSLKKLEVLKQLKLQGIELGEGNPIRAFYDSLALQPLPVSYSEDYVKLLADYSVVPVSIMTFLELEGRVAPKAIALPETLGTRLLLLAADQEDGEYELWLYSLDNDYYPVDKLLLYEPQRMSDKKLEAEAQRTYFSITSDYEVRIMEYASDNDHEGQLSTFIIDDSRMFVEHLDD